MLRVIFSISVLVCLILLTGNVQAENEHWTSLDGPYWANGIDVAVGDVDGLTGQRYLIGSDNNAVKLFHWDAIDNEWRYPSSDHPGAKKVISYKQPNNGDIAFFAEYEGYVYKTTNSGQTWQELLSTPANNLYNSIEVFHNIGESDPDRYVLAATKQSAGLASAYIYDADFGGGNWFLLGNQNPSNNLLYEKDVYDIESDLGFGIVAGASDGLYRHEFDEITFDPENQSPWEYLTGLRNHEIRVLETFDGYHEKQVAAVIDQSQNRKLYYSGLQDTWDNPVELMPGSSSFDKEVKDLAGVYWGYSYFSCYAATTEGLYILFFHSETTGDCTEIDVKDYYEPMRHDHNFISVDYYYYTDNYYKHAVAVATTPNNVYEVHETRQNDGTFEGITVTEIVNGTYFCNSVAVDYSTYTGGIDDIDILVVSGNGIIKKLASENWSLIGLTYEDGSQDIIDSDIAAIENGDNLNIIVSSYTNSEGKIVKSQDEGNSWIEISPPSNPRITCLTFDGPDLIYAAGLDDDIWKSTNGGDDWISIGSFPTSDFYDIITDERWAGEIFVGGSGSPKALWYRYDETWSIIEDGLELATINQFAHQSDHRSLYAATDLGCYKTGNMPDEGWTQRPFEIGNSDISCIVIDPNSTFNLLSASNNVIPPDREDRLVWASCDSAQHWVAIADGDVGQQDPIFNDLSASQVQTLGFIIGTDNGVYHLPNLFRSGEISESETWGPGKILSRGVGVAHSTLNIVPPCTLYFNYGTGAYLAASVNGVINGLGELGNNVVFRSTRSWTNPGDWRGITYISFSEINLDYCVIEDAMYGIGNATTNSVADKITINNCQFNNASYAGIKIPFSPVAADLVIENSVFEDCGSYGIYIYNDWRPNHKSCKIIDNEIRNCNNGIWYSGNNVNEETQKVVISRNHIENVGANGIFATRNQQYGPEPVIEVLSTSVHYAPNYGISFQSVSPQSKILGVELHSNSGYGIYLSQSSPLIDRNYPSILPNIIKRSKVGIFCDKYSGPMIRNTVLRDNSSYGILAEVKDPPAVAPPDIGTELWLGNNSFSNSNPSSFYRDIKNVARFTLVYAQGNWWGEQDPELHEIEGPVIYIPYLLRDPWDGIGKITSAVQHIPDKATLNQNYPNPFNPTTQISFSLVQPELVNLNVYNIRGQRVKTLVSDMFDSGEYTVVWDGRNDKGMDAASGIYFYSLSTDSYKSSKKMLLIR